MQESPLHFISTLGTPNAVDEPDPEEPPEQAENTKERINTEINEKLNRSNSFILNFLKLVINLFPAVILTEAFRKSIQSEVGPGLVLGA